VNVTVTYTLATKEINEEEEEEEEEEKEEKMILSKRRIKQKICLERYIQQKDEALLYSI